MLKSLEIKNFALIDRLKIELGGGLNVFTGETGAGKSILIEALGFVLGDRATTELIKTGATRMEVLAEFSPQNLAKEKKAYYGISQENFFIKRELDAKGRGRAFINARPAAVAELTAFGEGFVEFHGQHEHQSILKPSAHLELLDRFGVLEDEAAKIKLLYGERKTILEKLSAGKMSSEEKARMLDLYRYQLNEIEEADVKPGEDAEIENLLPRLKNADKIRALSQEIYALLYSEEGSALGKSQKAAKLLDELSALDSAAENTAQALRQAVSAVEQVAREIYLPGDSALSDPAELDRLLSRQDKLSKLKKKYGAQTQNVLEYAQSLKEKIAALASSDEKELELAERLKKTEKKYFELAKKLHEKRFECAKKLSRIVAKEIESLGFAEVKFSVLVEMEETISETGQDAVEFLFSPNPGQPLKPLKNIASGGEMSRVMLGIKTILADADKIPVLVF
ncbi:MAG: AAA family ATPase, partial [Elusimicrobia bacterium]|nr:AAA family ATPase [Elusimicrobiota bacterium]